MVVGVSRWSLPHSFCRSCHSADTGRGGSPRCCPRCPRCPRAVHTTSYIISTPNYGVARRPRGNKKKSDQVARPGQPLAVGAAPRDAVTQLPAVLMVPGSNPSGAPARLELLRARIQISLRRGCFLPFTAASRSAPPPRRRSRPSRRQAGAVAPTVQIAGSEATTVEGSRGVGLLAPAAPAVLDASERKSPRFLEPT